ncbi:hypothetical protein [Thalassotalea sediminis]|uniref:hypothetical protein n=1 Tax=Thalassotalea sediminis TaxID=1759089 RepID=UPI002573FB1A|nr:hypothetical protein [Thalassotalea sediminis]
MNRQRTSLFIASLVLGLGTVANASANQSSIEDTVNKAIVEQTKQVSQYLSQELNNSINEQLKATILSVEKPLENEDQLVAKFTPLTKKSVVEE